MKKIKKIKLNKVNIVGEGLVSAGDKGEGRFIPALILDTSNRPDIDEVIRVHQYCQPGDAESVWVTVPFSMTNVYLNIRFIKPVQCDFAITFISEEHVNLIYAILHSQALYFLSGQNGDKISTTMGRDRILVEVPRSPFANKWDNEMPKIIAKKFRKEGISKKTANALALEDISKIRDILTFRRD